MQAKQVFVVWGLLALSLVALGGATFAGWYEMTSDAIGSNGGSFSGHNAPSGFDDCFPPFCDDDFAAQQQEVEPPRYRLHTDFWHDIHEGSEGGSHTTADYQRVPMVAQVTSVFRTFYVIGLIGFGLAAIGLVLHMRGIASAKGLVTTIALLSLASIIFAIAHFSALIPGAYQEELEGAYGSRPTLALYSVGTASEDGFWSNVTSAPQLSWYMASVGSAAGIGAFAFAHAASLRRAKEIILDDQAAAARYESATLEREHVVERIRREGRQ